MEKIVYVNGRFLTQPVTGVQRFAIELSKEIKRVLGDGVVFVSPSGITSSEADKLKVVVIGNRGGHYWEQIELPKYLSKVGNPLLLNLCNTAPLFYTNSINTVHDLAFEVYPQSYSKKFLWFYRFLIPKIIRKAKHLLTVSEFSKKEINYLYKKPLSEISVIYNSVSDFFKKTVTSPSYSLKTNYFLTVSSLNYRKNFLGVLQAFDSLSQEFPNIALRIIGDLNSSSFRDLDISKYFKNRNVIIMGRVSDEELREAYSKAIGFIYPSFYEGFGIPPLEAQASGCPVLASDVSSLPEVLLDSALYCDPFSINSIKQGMEILLNNEVRKDFIKKGLNNVERFSWRRSADVIIDILRKWS